MRHAGRAHVAHRGFQCRRAVLREAALAVAGERCDDSRFEVDPADAVVADIGDGHERTVRAECAAHGDVELRLISRAAVAGEAGLTRAGEERRDVGLRVESDDAVLETVGEVDGAVGRDRDVVHAVVDGRRKVEALGGCGEIRRLAHAVPLHAGDILDLAAVQLEDPVRGLELHAVSVALGVEGDAEGLV